MELSQNVKSQIEDSIKKQDSDEENKDTLEDENINVQAQNTKEEYSRTYIPSLLS